jgi:excisionase family DNA binding protein
MIFWKRAGVTEQHCRGFSMYLSIKEAARLLNVSEKKLRDYISSGRLSVERKGKQILVSQSQLKALIDTGEDRESEASQADLDCPPAPSREEALELVLGRLAAIEGQINEKWHIFTENQRLHQAIREKDMELAARKLEIEKLHRDLVYQKRICEKEIEDYRLAQQEKLALMEKEASERMAGEREQLEKRLIEERSICSEKLAVERSAWSEKLAQEQERFAQRLAAMRDQEGFWSRLMKMITWS